MTQWLSSRNSQVGGRWTALGCTSVSGGGGGSVELGLEEVVVLRLSWPCSAEGGQQNLGLRRQLWVGALELRLRPGAVGEEAGRRGEGLCEDQASLLAHWG